MSINAYKGSATSPFHSDLLEIQYKFTQKNRKFASRMIKTNFSLT